ncbi:MAG: GTP cyclohydrolase II, partial [Pseudomonadota bacterium]
MTMDFRLNMSERIARARGDLRMGVPIVLRLGDARALAMAVETLTADRLTGLRAMGADPQVVITARRAETLKTAAYDGDLARIALPKGVDLRWVRGISDPAHDLSTPMKGPLRSLRSGDVSAERLAL